MIIVIVKSILTYKESLGAMRLQLIEGDEIVDEVS